MNPAIEERLRNPPPNSAIARARDFGIDLTLLIERSRLTPEERVSRLQREMIALDQIRGKKDGRRETGDGRGERRKAKGERGETQSQS